MTKKRMIKEKLINGDSIIENNLTKDRIIENNLRGKKKWRRNVKIKEIVKEIKGIIKRTNNEDGEKTKFIEKNIILEVDEKD